MALTVLDAGVLIAVMEQRDLHHSAAHRAVADERKAGHQLVLPAAAYAEIMVKPSARSDDAAHDVDDFVDALPATVEPVTRSIAAEAARLRARHGRRIRLPDALVIATATAIGAARVLTTDSGWPELGLDVQLVQG